MGKLIRHFLSPRPWLAKLFLATTIVTFLVLGHFGYFEPIKSVLNSDKLAFEIGEIRFSAYLFLKAIIALAILFWLAGLFADLGEKKIGDIESINKSNRTLLTKLLQIFIYFLAIVIGLEILGIDLTALTVLGGAVGIGIGFGLQKITSNYISGLILLIEKSIEVGDLVELSDGTAGIVRDAGARYTLVETFEGREIMIPNEDFITNRVTNWTFSNSRGRIDLDIGVSYGSDVNQVQQLILQCASNHPRCSKVTPPDCFLVEFGDSSVNFRLFFWVDDVLEGRMRPRSELLFSIWNTFKEHNIEIPFPQRDLHIKNPEAMK